MATEQLTWQPSRTACIRRRQTGSSTSQMRARCATDNVGSGESTTQHRPCVEDVFRCTRCCIINILNQVTVRVSQGLSPGFKAERRAAGGPVVARDGAFVLCSIISCRMWRGPPPPPRTTSLVAARSRATFAWYLARLARPASCPRRARRDRASHMLASAWSWATTASASGRAPARCRALQDTSSALYAMLRMQWSYAG